MARIPFTADAPLGDPGRRREPGAGRGGPCPFTAASPSPWVRLRVLAEAVGVALSSVRDQARRLPSHARRRVGREVEIDTRFMPGEWRTAIATAHKAKADPWDASKWRKADLRRDSEINGILDAWETHYAAWCRRETMMTERTADARFSRARGDGYYAISFKPSTLRRWRRMRRLGQSFQEQRGRKSGTGATMIGVAARARFFGEYLRAGVPLTVAYQTTAAESARHTDDAEWAWPSEPTVRRWMKSEHNEFYTDSYRKGWQAWRVDHEPKLVRDQHDLPGNELWELDGTTADYFVNYCGRKVRPTVINVVDVATRLVVGWSVGRAESQETVLRAFRRAVERYGAPRVVRSDLGKAFLGEAVGDAKGRRKGIDLVGVFEGLNITLETCVGRSPWQKGNSEAVFNAFRQRYAPLHGRAFIGNSHKSRVPGVDKWCDAHIGKLKTIEQDDELVGLFFEAENRRPRRDMFNVSPLQKFEATAIEKRTVPPELLDYLFARVQRVRVSNRGIPVAFGPTKVYFGQGDPRVWELVGRNVIVRVNDADATSIWVCSERGDALFKVANDEVRGLGTDALREAGKRKRKARKAVREHWDNVDVAHAHPIDTALKLQREHADALAAKTADKMPARERGEVTIANRMTASLKNIKREELRMAAGSEGMTPSGPSLSDLSRGMVSRAIMEDSGPALRDLVPSIGKDATDDLFRQRLLEA